ncbi:MAG: S53 family peptidase [Gaiellales bacterium]
MSAFSEHVRLRQSGTGSRPKDSTGDVPGDERIDVTVLMRPGSEHDAGVISSLMGNQSPAERDHLGLEALESSRATSSDDVAAVKQFADHFGLTMSDVHPERQSVTLSGTADQMRAAFEVTVERVETDGATYRARTSPVHVPKELSQIVTAVVGFDTRPQVIPHIRTAAGTVASRAAGLRPFTPIEVADLYSFPPNTDGSGQTVAVLEFGGGLNTNDLNTYFNSLGISTPPDVVSISVDGATTDAGRDTGADGEVQLDVDVIGAVAPRSTIVVYFAPNSARGFVNALKAAIHNPDHRPCAISISWGMAEENWSEQTRNEMDQAFQDAGTLGITVTAASGDDGSTDNQPQGAPHVDYPAASPWVLGCGGTQLEAANGTISAETVWDDLSANGGASGGGISHLYSQPDWQSANKVQRADTGGEGRGVPDVAGNACPSTGYKVRVDGQDTVVGGTSAVAPLWAALTARLTQGLNTSIGFMQPFLAARSGWSRDITEGSNGAYDAGAGWDPCTGWGSPNGQAIMSAMAVTTTTSTTA